MGNLVSKWVDSCSSSLKTDCAIELNSSSISTDIITQIGPYPRGQLPALPDVVGQGIWLSLIYPLTLNIIAIGFAFDECVKRGFISSNHGPSFPPIHVGWWRKMLDWRVTEGEPLLKKAIRKYVLSTADGQIVLAVAYSINFGTLGKCELSSYHTVAALDMMLVALSTMVLSLAMVRTYYRSPIAAAIRLTLILGIFILVGTLLFSQRSHSFATEWPSPSSRTDSLILLPVVCLLDQTGLANVTKAIKAKGADLNTTMQPVSVEFILFLALIICLALAIFAALIRWGGGRHGEPGETRTLVYNVSGRIRGFKVFVMVYWAIVLFVPWVTIVYSFSSIGRARAWATESGWFGIPNPEDNILKTGQVLALVSGITICISVASELRETSYEKYKYRLGT